MKRAVFLACVVLASFDALADPPASLDVKVDITGVLPDVLKQASDLCDPSPKGQPMQVVKMLGLSPQIVESDTVCRLLQENVWGDDRPDYVFNFVTPTNNGSRFQTVVVYSAAGERVGLYHAQNFPLDLDIVARANGLPSYIHLEGSGRWMEENVGWAGTFRLENGKFIPVPDKAGGVPPAPRCPDTKPMSIDRQNGVHRRDMRAAICPDEDCFLGCVDAKHQAACGHNIGAYWVGSFATPGALEVLLEMRAAEARHGSSLYLMQATPCAWRQLGVRAGFTSTQDDCSQMQVGGRDLIVCRQHRGAESASDDGLAVYVFRDGQLAVDVPFRTHATPPCHPGELITSAISDVSYEDPDSQGVVRVDVQIDAARITWTNRGPDSETCAAATQRLTESMKSHTIQLELTREGLRVPVDQLEQLKSDPIPGLILR